MLDILAIALPFFGLILLGVIAARIWKHDESGLTWLNIFIVYFALPALIFSVVAATPLDQLLRWSFVAAVAGVTILSFLTMTIIALKLFSQDLRTATLQGTAASYGNVGYMGLPLAVAFFGPAAAVPAAIVFCIDCTVEFLMTSVLAGQGRNGLTSRRAIVAATLRDVATHPFIVATLLGIAASAWGFAATGALKSILEMLSRAAGPVALFAMGVTVSARRFSGVGRELPVLAFLKIAAQPAVIFFALYLLAPGIDPVWRNVAVMMAALPTASNAFILARQYDAYVDGAGAAVIATTCLSVISIPLIVYLLQ